jgi:hypothetical protein
VSDKGPLHPTQSAQSPTVSDKTPLHPTHVSDNEAPSDTQQQEQSQDVDELVSDVSDKSVGDPPSREHVPAPNVDISGIKMGVIQFPQGGAGRKARTQT